MLIKKDYEGMHKNFKLKNILLPISLCSQPKKTYLVCLCKSNVIVFQKFIFKL